jgi:translin
VRAAGRAVRAVHRHEPERAAELAAESERALRAAQEALRGCPAVAHAGFLHDAEKEYAEAVLTAALTAGLDLPGPDDLSGALTAGLEVPGPDDLGVGVPAWLNGLAEAASELRRHLLDLLRRDETGRAEELLSVMEDVYEALVTVDLPDAVTGGLRRATDALRAVLERTRSDVTATVVQVRLRSALERRYPVDPPAGV